MIAWGGWVMFRERDAELEIVRIEAVRDVPLRALEEWANAKAADESRRERKSVRLLAADSS